MAKPAPKLERTTFITSRELEYFSAKELSRELGSNSVRWPLVLTKELIDNGLDACETSDIAPSITVALEGTKVCVSDNGPGMPESTLRASLDYNSRISDKAHYISPTRGQIGNALKCLGRDPLCITASTATMRPGALRLRRRSTLTDSLWRWIRSSKSPN